MVSKSETRRLKKELGKQKFEANKKEFISKTFEKCPKTLKEVSSDKTPHIAPQLTIAGGKIIPPKTANSSRYQHPVAYCISKSDQIGQWSWGEARKWEGHEWENIIHPSFEEIKKLTWGEVDHFASGTGHKMHHSHEWGDIIEEAQNRWIELGLEQFETLFRFRIGGQTSRAWGFIVQSHFFFVWWDRNHRIYPTST